MNKYYDIDTDLYGTAADVVHSLHTGSRAKCTNDEAWMRETAERIKTYNGADIRCLNPDDFVQDLIGTGLLDTVKEK